MNNDTPNIGPVKADCDQCEYSDVLLQKNKCEPGDACIKVKSGRQIDRFFKNNPGLADEYLRDPFWETRAIAVRYASQSRLEELINDVDEVVRRAVAYRIPVDKLLRLATDPDREVRITVADRLPISELEQLVDDKDYLVRVYVARRLPAGRLFRMLCDEDEQVRKEVARRIPPASLGLLTNDPEADIRRVVAERIEPASLEPLLHDSEWLVRLVAAERAPLELLKNIDDETEPDVIEVIEQRLKSGN